MSSEPFVPVIADSATDPDSSTAEVVHTRRDDQDGASVERDDDGTPIGRSDLEADIARTSDHEDDDQL